VVPEKPDVLLEGEGSLERAGGALPIDAPLRLYVCCMRPSAVLLVVSSTQGCSGMRPSRLFSALRRKSTSASVRSCGIYRHERRATEREKWGKSK
jgi:hypothetical protein